MLKDKTSSAIVGVSDLDRARTFYAEMLGLELAGGAEEDVLTFRTGSSELNVYSSKGVRPSTANAVTWGAGGDVEAIARDLAAKGVTLEEYPDLGMDIADGVHRAGDFSAIWFKDPDGNILHVNSM